MTTSAPHSSAILTVSSVLWESTTTTASKWPSTDFTASAMFSPSFFVGIATAIGSFGVPAVIPRLLRAARRSSLWT
ncbi:hypothetical protein GA0115253_103882 [Streptomyces sp. Termitarium-T10T-6]|nr:hypothetical protein GA0115253_103882 [Streptomyces sp. Termitarium-T10T-6]